MDRQDLIGFLGQMDLFSAVSDDLLYHVADGVELLEVPAGTRIFNAGDPGDAVYLIVKGQLKIEREGVHIVMQGEGACVGEYALIDDGPRSAAAIAHTDVRLLRWGRGAFQRTLSQSPEVASGLLKILIAKLRQNVTVQVRAGLERERWQQDLRRAREIQMGMLPSGDFSMPGIELSGYCRPAAEVGGDYYDYLPVGENMLGVILGDVTGHGFYSGLFVAMAKSCLHTQGRVDSTPEQVMQAMNRSLTLSIESGMLMTCCYILFDFPRRRLVYTNAGHPFPFHYRRATGALERLESTDMLLGIPGFESYAFTRQERRWEPGDLLVLYSDGIEEAMDANGEMFEEDRLTNVLRENVDQEPGQIKDAVLKAVEVHCGGVELEDDVTVVVARAG